MDTDLEWDFEVRPRPMDLVGYSVRHKTLGPSHDPYSRITITVTSGKNNIIYVSCALAGVAMHINGVSLLNLSDEESWPRGRWSDKDWELLMETWFEALTGVRVEDVLFWELERSTALAEVAMAELRAGWDPNP
jgi:hypothetical protein